MKRMVVAVVYIAFILACSTDEDGSIENTGNDKAILSYFMNLEGFEEQVSGPNSILEQNEDRVDSLPRIQMDCFPECMFRPVPDYPESARTAGIEGEVLINFYIDTTGTIKEIEVLQSSGFSILDQVALDAAWNSCWIPAESCGVCISTWTSLNYKFTLCE